MSTIQFFFIVIFYLFRVGKPKLLNPYLVFKIHRRHRRFFLVFVLGLLFNLTQTEEVIP